MSFKELTKKKKTDMKNYLQNLAAGFAILLIALPVIADGVTHIWTIGDSTMCNYKQKEERRGWCQELPLYINANAKVHNHGHSGYSSKQFYNSKNDWGKTIDSIQAGDILIIQFAHNDEKGKGLDNDTVKALGCTNSVDKRGTTPNGSYKTYLKKFIEEARAKGATPVLATSICRRKFDANGNITRSGRHDLGDSYQIVENKKIVSGPKLSADDHTMDFSYQLEQVAQEENVPYIDLMTVTKNEWERLYAAGGVDSVKQYFRTHEQNDETHLNEPGAQLVAKMAAKLFYDGDTPLKPFINTEAAGITTNGISKANAEGATVVSKTYYSIDGTALSHPLDNGITIVRQKNSDGSVTVKKVAGRDF